MIHGTKTDSYGHGLQNWHIFGRYCESSNGRVAYYYNMLNNVFGSLCTLTGTPATTLDVPQNDRGGKYANFMKIGNSVMRAGNASIRFGVSGSDRVKVKLSDVTGRQIRTLADRAFPAGEHSLTWDGSDDSGNQVARGVGSPGTGSLPHRFAPRHERLGAERLLQPFSALAQAL